MAHLGVNSGAVPGILDRLEQQGYTRLAPNPDDRRGTLVSLDLVKAAGFITAFTSINDELVTWTEKMSRHSLEAVRRFFCYVTELASHSRQPLRKHADARQSP